jgi:hypothetical protein
MQKEALMHKFALVLLSACLPVALFAQTVEVGEGDWSDIPRMAKDRDVVLGVGAMERVDKIVAAGKCKVIGRKGKIKMLIPFIVKFAPDQSVKRLVVKRIGCPEVEQLAASVALYSAKSGHIKPTGENQTGWYSGVISYILE